MAREFENLVDWTVFSRTRAELGAHFVRILGYFQEDGVKSVAAIEKGLRNGDAAAIVVPAHTLKGEARQFGAMPLAALAEEIESIGRDCVETHDSPDPAVELAVDLRPIFSQTIALLLREANPLVERQPRFGRRPATSFGRAG